MIVAGGFYYERCFSPSVEALFGSGGRAAAALSRLAQVELHTFFPTRYAEDVILNMAAFGVRAQTYSSTEVVKFFYQFPLSPPRIAPVPLPTADPVILKGDKILRFGCLEGEFIIHSQMAVFDPQSGGRPQEFTSNGSTADRLAVVLNAGELATLSPAPSMEAQIAGLKDSPVIAIVKDGPRGAFVFENGKLTGQVPIYRSERVYKIGSGDIFSAVFAYYWMDRGASAIQAADAASRYVAFYVSTREAQMPKSPPEMIAWTPKREPAKVYLAGSFFSTEHLWLVEESRMALMNLGIPCFSPMHDVGISAERNVAKEDLTGLEDCDVVLALTTDNDPGTLFEVGHAIATGKRVVVLSECPGPQDLTMLEGTRCLICNDLATAIYETAWRAME